MKELNVEQMAALEGGCLGAKELDFYDLEELLSAWQDGSGQWHIDGKEICR